MIGKKIKELRQEKGFSQREFADKIGVSKSAVASWEIDRTEPNIAMLYKIAEALDTTVGALTDSEPPKSDNVVISKGDQVFLNMMHELDDMERSEILNRIFEMLNRR